MNNVVAAIAEFKKKYDVNIFEGEDFKQAYYNDRLTETVEQLVDKMELAMKHFPKKDLSIGLYETDDQLAFSVVTPV